MRTGDTGGPDPDGRLVTRPNLADADGAYARLIAAHDGLSISESAALNARLVLILANHAGDAALSDALELATRSP